MKINVLYTKFLFQKSVCGKVRWSRCYLHDKEVESGATSIVRPRHWVNYMRNPESFIAAVWRWWMWNSCCKGSKSMKLSRIQMNSVVTMYYREDLLWRSPSDPEILSPLLVEFRNSGRSYREFSTIYYWHFCFFVTHKFCDILWKGTKYKLKY